MHSELRLVDEFENVYFSAGEIGRGGQGIVLRTRDSDIAVKLVTGKDLLPLVDPAACAAALERLRRLRLLPVPASLQLARPVAALRSPAGYVMRLLDAMRSFKDVFESTPTLDQGDMPPWLAGLARENLRAAEQLADYAATGAARTRLLLLARCAAVLARLHAAGLVYGDLSPANVFTSGAGPDDQVWLIDADNVHVEGQAMGAAYYTDGYGAPEVMRRESGASFQTDCHAFAVLAFSILCLGHPFKGDLVNAGEDWSDPDANRGQQALEGRLPWIHDTRDTSNSSSEGLAPQLTCTPRMAALFDACFGAGRTAPWRRPSMLHWPEALAAAADCSVHCAGCGMSYFAVDYEVCLYCATERPRVLRLDSYRWPAVDRGPCWTFLLAADGLVGTALLPGRIFLPFSLSASDEPVLSLAAEAGGYRLRRLRHSGPTLQIARAGVREGRFEALDNFHLGEQELAAGVSIFVPGAHARFVRLSWMEEA